MRLLNRRFQPVFWVLGLATVVVVSANFPTETSQLENSDSNRISPVSRAIIHSDATGKQIYEKQCASCHGKDGQGVADHYDEPLVGELSLEKLTKLVAETMPEDDPDACVGKDAEKVSRYIYDQFYSRAAQKKRAVPKKRLARLTQQQFINSVADLVATFQWRITTKDFYKQEKRGLKATYYHSRHFRGNKRIKTRVEQNVDVDFGDQLPDVIPKPKPPKKKSRNLEYDPTKEFSVQWVGGIAAEKTGEYEFIVRSKNGFRLFVNDYTKPVIDQWVTSTGNEYRTKVYLLGGRVYPFKVDFFRFRDPTSGISVSWKPPHQTEHVIPQSVLYPEWTGHIGIVHAAFPPDDSSSGYNRGTSVSAQWDEAVTAAATEVSDWCIRHLRINRIKKGKITEKQNAQMKSFCIRFVETAFGRKLNKAERQFYVEQFFDPKYQPIERIKLVVILTLKSPHFLYPELPTEKTTENQRTIVAKRLALYFWDSIPDQQLIDASRAGHLENADASRPHFERLLNDYRTRQKIDSFFEYWLNLGEVEETTKDEKTYPDFKVETAIDLRQSINHFVDDIFWSDDSDYRKLFSADYMYANASLAKFYSLDSTPFNDSKNADRFVKTKADKNKFGLVTHPYLLTGLAYHKNSSPIHRGVFIARSLLGRKLKQPPDDVEPLTEEFNPKMTTRERVEHQTKATACMSCHGVINSLGFSLENFDAVGRFRKTEKQKEINAVSNYETIDGNQIRFDGPEGLAKFIANNPHAQKSFLRHLFQHLAKQPVEAYGHNALDQIHAKFVASRFNMKTAVIEIAKYAAFHDIQLNRPAKPKSETRKQK